MAIIKPFCALRYTNKIKNINEVLCPPYDIISEDERKNFLKTNEHNIIRLELPKEGENPYKTAGKTLKLWIFENILKKDFGLYHLVCNKSATRVELVEEISNILNIKAKIKC